MESITTRKDRSVFMAKEIGMSLMQNSYVQVVLSSVAVYLFMIAAIRLFGKKELSQLSVIDLVFILLISNSVQNAMVGSNTSLTGGLAAAAALFITNYIFKQFLFRFPKFSRMVQGEEMMLVYKGTLNRDNLKKARITEEELIEAVREHGVAGIADVDLAILEVDGNISVLSDDFSSRSTRKRRSKQGLTRDNG
jgi:uncharacterized membrane protein YcaP (DUF421 family)